MAEGDELAALRERVAQLEASRRPRVNLVKVALGAGVVLFFLVILSALVGPKTYGDIANEDAADCVRTGNDGHWFPGDGNLQDLCQIRGDMKALQRQGVDSAQKR